MFDTLLTGFIVLLLIFTCAWIVQLFTRNATLVDPIWALSVGIVTIFYIFTSNQELKNIHVVGISLGLLWSLRLGIMLALRVVREKEEDKRYAIIRQAWQPNAEFKILIFFWVQAVISLILSFPFLIIIYDPNISFGASHVLAMCICFGALIGELFADEQLRQFKNNTQGKVCNVGLWRYSRHPNYFFDWVYWVGVALYVFPAMNGWIALLCPVMMYFVLVKMTGIPMLEELALQSRGEAYANYQVTTNKFFPGPPKERIS